MSPFPTIPGYRIERQIGQGGMATVYLAVQESLERQVAIKVMAPALGADPTFSERFQKEGRTIARLTHPHIVTVFDIGVADGHHYIAMEYVGGDNLKIRMRSGVAAGRALAIVRQIACALGFAHSNGFVHRDVKPENILFRDNGDAVLTDFGIAKTLGADTRMTATGMSIGTPSYMSPEQARGQPVDARSDLYSLGVMLYELLSGSRPYVSEDSFALAYKHINDPIPRLPEEFERYQPLIDTLLAKQPDDRYADAQALINAIDRVEGGEALDPVSAATVVMPTTPTQIMPTPAGSATSMATAETQRIEAHTPPRAPMAGGRSDGTPAGAVPEDQGRIIAAPYRGLPAWARWTGALALVAVVAGGVYVFYPVRPHVPAGNDARPVQADNQTSPAPESQAASNPVSDDALERLRSRWRELRTRPDSSGPQVMRDMVRVVRDSHGVLPAEEESTMRAQARQLLEDSMARAWSSAPGGCDPSAGDAEDLAATWRAWMPDDQQLPRALAAGVNQCLERAEKAIAAGQAADARALLGHAVTIAGWLPARKQAVLDTGRYEKVVSDATQLEQAVEREQAQRVSSALDAVKSALGAGDLSSAEKRLAEARSAGASPGAVAPLERKLVDLGTRRKLAEDLLVKARTALDAQRLSEAQGHCDAAHDFFPYPVSADAVCADVQKQRKQVQQQWQNQNIGVIGTERVR